MKYNYTAMKYNYTAMKYNYTAMKYKVGFNKYPIRLTRKLVSVFLHELQHVLVRVRDHEPVSEHFNNGTDVEVLGSVEHRLVRRTVGLGDTGSLQELSTDNARVSYGWFVHRHHVVGETVRDDEATTLVLRSYRVLESNASM